MKDLREKRKVSIHFTPRMVYSSIVSEIQKYGRFLNL